MVCVSPPPPPSTHTHTHTHTFRSTVEFAHEVAETKVMDDALDRLDEMFGSSGSHDTFSPPRMGSALPPQGRELARVCTRVCMAWCLLQHVLRSGRQCTAWPGACYDMSCTVGDSVQYGLVLATTCPAQWETVYSMAWCLLQWVILYTSNFLSRLLYGSLIVQVHCIHVHSDTKY